MCVPKTLLQRLVTSAMRRRIHVCPEDSLAAASHKRQALMYPPPHMRRRIHVCPGRQAASTSSHKFVLSLLLQKYFCPGSSRETELAMKR
jgi:hypothetical protein